MITCKIQNFNKTKTHCQPCHLQIDKFSFDDDWNMMGTEFRGFDFLTRVVIIVKQLVLIFQKFQPKFFG